MRRERETESMRMLSRGTESFSLGEYISWKSLYKRLYSTRPAGDQLTQIAPDLERETYAPLPCSVGALFSSASQPPTSKRTPWPIAEWRSVGRQHGRTICTTCHNVILIHSKLSKGERAGRISLEHHVDLSDNSILGAKIASEHSGNPCGIVQVLEVNLTNHVRVTV